MRLLSLPGVVASVCLLLAACAPPAPPPEPVFIPVPPPVEGKAKPLSDFTAEDLRGLYGPPAFVRKEAGLEVWRYDVGACRIFFFIGAKDGGNGVRLYESVPPAKPGRMDRNCFNALELRIKKQG